MKINDINHRTEIHILRNERDFIRLDNLFLIKEIEILINEKANTRRL